MNLVVIVATAAICLASCASTAATAPAQQQQSLRVAARELLTPTRPPPFCVREEATDFVDNDLSNKPGQVGDCCGYCDASNECAAWSWSNYNGGTCWLKRGRGTVVVNPDVISGVKMGYQELYPCADLEYGVDFVGYDIGSVRMLKPADCCLECSRFPGCKAFTHTKYNDGTCWLKSQKGRMIYNLDATSSVAYGTSASVPNCGLEVNVDYVGNDIGSAKASQPGECCAKCQAFAGCRAFSWSASTNTCYFKNRKDATIAKSGVTSATVFPNPRAPSCAMELGTDYVGNDIGSAPSTDPYGCCSICMKAGGCGAFSWTNQNGGTCWLKSAKGATAANPNVKSAVV